MVSSVVRSPIHLPILLGLCLAACSSDDPATPATPAPQPDAGADAAPDSAVQDAPLESDAPAELDATPDTTADAAQPGPYAIFVASNFADSAEGTLIDLSGASQPNSLLSSDQDTIAAGSGGKAFLLHRTTGEVRIIDPADPFNHLTLTGFANPYDAVVVAADKAYVVSYGSNEIAVLDLVDNEVLGHLDLSSFVADPDDLVDAFAAVYDPATGRVYVGLQRINQTVFGDPPDYVAPCTDTTALLLGIDVATDTIVDINGTGDGLGIALSSVNPSSLAWDGANNRVIVLGVGCAEVEADGGTSRRGRGVEEVDMATATTSWLWNSTALDRPASLIWMSSEVAVLGLDDASFTRHWWSWNPQTDTLGDELEGVPSVPVHDGNGGLVGLTTVDGTDYSAVRYNLSDGSVELLADDLFGSVTGPMFPVSSAAVL